MTDGELIVPSSGQHGQQLTVPSSGQQQQQLEQMSLDDALRHAAKSGEIGRVHELLSEGALINKDKV